jgi:hypothetical protein
VSRNQPPSPPRVDAGRSSVTSDDLPAFWNAAVERIVNSSGNAAFALIEGGEVYAVLSITVNTTPRPFGSA